RRLPCFSRACSQTCALPISGWGFGGNGTQYHGAHDTYTWMSKHAVPGFRYHATTAELTAIAALRLANAEVLPFDYGEFARELREIGRVSRRESGFLSGGGGQ